ncbi:MAG: bifunctional phosphoribosylaminoimidazolecarboxamide formyltransferase/IMP cyclohydrolase [Chlorobi bacterium]|nr:bifunctional phosphoribosylaminoimidazolecarboxamide formyltransferase/IMP cyclohydrolase [Chlorobiota bacterium]
MISTAIISVSDKTGLIPFATELRNLGIAIISTGGTARYLQKHGIDTIPVSEVTGFPEILDGRVKTLHPVIHAGLLAKRNDEGHVSTLATHNIKPIDLVVVNLYPFEETAAQKSINQEEVIEQIDIGGPSMLRSAAKNYESVTVVTDPADYERVLSQIVKTGDTTPELRRELALKVFQRTAAYDSAIAQYLEQAGHESGKESTALPSRLFLSLPMNRTLRYGENPHQKAALYGDFLDRVEVLHGKELSFNNIVDINAALALIREFDDRPAAAIIKHTNPCGCAVASETKEAYLSALSTDRVSAFGGIIVVNRPVDEELAELFNEMFSEVIIAPGFMEAAMPVLRKKKNRRLVRYNAEDSVTMNLDVKIVPGGALVQTPDSLKEDIAAWKVVTRREPTAEEWSALAFAWTVAKHVKSNAIVYANERQTLGIGAGQMSRIDASSLAVFKAREAGLSLENSVLASDAFFPFADGLLAGVKAGATAVIQPGGSVRDEEVIAAADEHGVAMVFTGVRHFKH